MEERLDLSEFKRMPIIEVALDLGIELQRGSKSRCFVHEDNDPSLVFFRDSNRWYCFGCNAGGDTIELVKRYLNVDFKEALAWLRERYQIEAKPSRTRTSTSGVAPEKFKPDPAVYRWLLDSLPLSPKGYRYLVESRGLDETTVHHFGIKDLEHPHRLMAEARQVWGERRLLKCGLLKQRKEGDAKPVWWGHVILFPFADAADRVLSIQGRRLDMSKGGPRYINLSGVKTTIFNQKVLATLTPGDSIFICEGIMDTLIAHQIGFNAVGIPGAAGFKQEWCALFDGLQVNVVPDTDGAGQRFAQQIAALFAARQRPVKIIRLPHGKDLSDYWQGEP